MSKYIKTTLTNSEKIEYIFPLHWSVWIRVVFIFLIGLITLPLLGLGIIFIIMGIIAIFGTKGIEYGITNRKLISKKGLIFRESAELKLNKVESVYIRQGIFGRMFGCGSVYAKGTGSSVVLFNFVADPLFVKNRIDEIVDKIQIKNE